MPHITVEYTNTVAGTIDIEGLVASLHEAAVTTGTFPIGGIRTSRIRPILARVGDSAPGNGFVQIQIRIAPGRSGETKKAVVRTLFEAAEKYLQPVFDRGPMALQLELSEFDPALTVSRNSMLPARPAGLNPPHRALRQGG